MALNAKLNKKEYHTFAILGDGECNEGSVWETAMLAAQNRLDNFTLIIDNNNMQAMGFCQDIISTETLADKWKAFGWNVNVVDGSDHEKLRVAFKSQEEGKPNVIIAKTTKGKGISFMENQLMWHYRDPQGDDYERAVLELEKKRNF